MQNCHQRDPVSFPPLESVTAPTVNTATAAHFLNRRPQTLRAWACHQNGPVRPLLIFGRLAWPVAAIRELVSGQGVAP